MNRVNHFAAHLRMSAKQHGAREADNTIAFEQCSSSNTSTSPAPSSASPSASTSASSSTSTSTSTSTSSSSNVGPHPQVNSWEEMKKLSVEDLRDRFGRPRTDGMEFDGVNHVAFVSSNMAKTLWFWCEVLGFRLIKTLDIPGGQHFFIDGGRGCAIAYFYFDEAPKHAPGVATIDMEELIQSGKFPTAWGSVNHVAFNVPAQKLREYRRRIKSAGMFVSPIMYHSDANQSGYTLEKDENTVWESVYFIGPDGEYLEMTSQTDRAFTPERDINHKPATGEKD